MDEAQEDRVEFLEARENTTKALQTAKKPLNLMSFAAHSRQAQQRVVQMILPESFDDVVPEISLGGARPDAK